MNLSEFLFAVKADRNRLGNGAILKYYFFNDGYKIAFHYRICQLTKSKKILLPFSFLSRIIYRFFCVLYGCDIPSNVQIGYGLKIDHPVGIVINSGALIGNNFTIKAGSVIGKKDESGAAVIGDNVMVGVHAIILGNVYIGNNVDIAAGAIITHNVPNDVVVRNLVKNIIKKKCSFKNQANR